ncbi:ABC transporter substrate-binding protein [Mesorhizobium sp. M5C.F.Ca.IN.020.32.2.1]|uniref:ABC transporter substrate-binding protein n=1 Tax=Mesorhizobium sp. M5C.F.Ca.IN.020.32.2.1 TaxID=2496771 RepID=UPI000FD2934F|nr:ABC transporter substrate-binding protein [Mesorhizobium sp. M5C.F.Ca.IN.020.32.2.1]RUV26811.1 ABC transporter substrate-binding protein [Mesorhizobium sp. M5C.F.Ca.IN.020.32.2.1]
MEMKRTLSALLGLLAGTTLFAGVPSGAKAEDVVTEIRIVEAGGKSGESIEKGYITPFTQKTGVKVVRESPNRIGKLQAMIASGKVSAALFELVGSELQQAKALNLLEPLDWNAIDPLPIFPEARDDYGLGYQYYSTIMTWRKDAKAPSTWADFWNVKDFPGKRALPDSAYSAIPIALLADGVKPDQLYPLDLDRAFKSLKKLSPQVAVWWTTGAQPPQLLNDNEVQYAVAWSGRVTAEPMLDYSFNQGLIDTSFFTVPRGADPAQKAAAMKLLHEMTVPENQAAAANVISYTGNSPQLDALLPKDRIGQFPTAKQNKDVQVGYDLKWWFDHGKEVEERWLNFKLER